MKCKPKILFFFIFTLFFIKTSTAQNLTLTGKVTDGFNNQNVYATVFDTISKTGASTNELGKFSLLLSKGEHIIKVNCVGYKERIETINITKDTSINFALEISVNDLKVVVVSAQKADQNISSTEIGVERLSKKQIERIPIIMGEIDILKTIQLLPGINSVAEGKAGFIVRGGGLDQNLMLMDEMPIYYASHMRGLYSVYNSAAVSSFTIYKGGVPARFGGRSSSVLDVRMVNSNLNEFKGEVSMGLITSKFAIEAPIIKNKLSVFVAGRATQAGFGYMYDQMNSDNTTVEKGKGTGSTTNTFFEPEQWFYDINGKIIYQINSKNRLTYSLYQGRDNGYTDAAMLTRWGNTAMHLKWRNQLNSRWSSSASLIYSKYQSHGVQGPYDFASSIGTYGIKEELAFIPNDKNLWRFGLQSEYQDFNHGSLLDETQNDGGKFMPPMHGLESALYAENEQKITKRLTALYGLRLSMYNRLGKGNSNVYHPITNLSVSQQYYGSSTDIIQTYINPEPRISATYKLSGVHSIKASYNRNAQYLRLMTMGSDITWYDIWMPSTENITPILTDQFSLGYFRNFLNNQFEFSSEAYYKMQNGVSDFEDGLHNFLVSNLEAYVAQGQGESYGIELSLEKPQGNFTGRISYNLGRSMMQIDNINKGEWYNSMFDITHSLNFISSYSFTKIKALDGLTISANFVYYTGRPVTLPESYYDIGGVAFPYWEARNEYRLPDFIRMDLGLKYEPKYLAIKTKNPKKKLQPMIDISLYNLLNRRNVFAINHSNNTIGKGTTATPTNNFTPYGRSTFGFIPSFQLTLKF